MDIVKDGNYFLMAHWKTIYESRQEVRIRKLIKGLFDYGGWSGLHIALWTWLSLDGKREKTDWFEKFNVPRVINDCFACKTAKKSFYRCRLTTEDENCKPEYCYYCPLINWEAEECLNGLYGKWLKADLEGREDLAREIATMEWVTK